MKFLPPGYKRYMPSRSTSVVREWSGLVLAFDLRAWKLPREKLHWVVCGQGDLKSGGGQ